MKTTKRSNTRLKKPRGSREAKNIGTNEVITLNPIRTRQRSVSFSRKQSRPTPSLLPPENNLTQISKPSSILKQQSVSETPTPSLNLIVPKKTKLQLTGLEKAIYQAAKKLYPKKRITQQDILTKWKQSGILSIEEFADLPKTLRDNALDGDRHFYLSLTDLRKVYPKIDEDKIRQYAYIIERYIHSCYEEN